MVDALVSQVLRVLQVLTVMITVGFPQWVTDPFVLVHASSDLPVAMLAAMLSCVVWWSALVGHCPFGCLAHWWLVPGFQMFFVSRVLAAMLDAAAKMVSIFCVLCFRVLQGFRGNVKEKKVVLGL